VRDAAIAHAGDLPQLLPARGALAVPRRPPNAAASTSRARRSATSRPRRRRSSSHDGARRRADGGALLIGIDLRKDRATLERAYDDAAGVTAAFNRNLLVRINRELGADFALDALPAPRALERAARSHRDAPRQHAAQTVRVGGVEFDFAEDEPIVTEYSFKYTAEAFGALAAQAGWRQCEVWTDPERLFSVQLLEPELGQPC
jgi:hypothetical protein